MSVSSTVSALHGAMPAFPKPDRIDFVANAFARAAIYTEVHSVFDMWPESRRASRSALVPEYVFSGPNIAISQPVVWMLLLSPDIPTTPLLVAPAVALYTVLLDSSNIAAASEAGVWTQSRP